MFATRVLSDSDPCASCGRRAVVVSEWYRLSAPSLLMPRNGQPSLTEAVAHEAYSLCLYCLRRERRTGSRDSWQVAQVLLVEETQNEDQQPENPLAGESG